jgi:hypothetical protein
LLVLPTAIWLARVVLAEAPMAVEFANAAALL